MRALSDRIADLTRAHGPLDVARFMTLVLADRQAGYYITKDPLGSGGDFTTSPEISQIFGELVGAAMAQAWIEMDSPERVNLVEFGPGHGTLMSDALRATRNLAGWHQAIDLHLIETSPVLRNRQTQALGHFAPRFHNSLETVPNDKPLLAIGNEFLDCLPIHQFYRTERGFQERLITLDDQDRLTFTLDPRPVTIASDLPPGSILETAPAREALVDEMAHRLRLAGGLAILIDYGSNGAHHGNTFQAVRAHKPTDPLEDLGESDLTAHVDFKPLSRSAKAQGCRVFGPIDQRTWLARLGAGERYQQLSAKARPEQREALATGLARLLDPNGMGTLFQVMSITTRSQVPGFEAEEEFV